MKENEIITKYKEGEKQEKPKPNRRQRRKMMRMLQKGIKIKKQIKVNGE
tara:strand:- start:968 stop:1114 length:147 start_codon:yes stop_codon:yes gene_type:complete